MAPCIREDVDKVKDIDLEDRAFSYRTIEEPAEGLFTEKRSKFISFAFPVESEEEAMTRVEEIRKKYYDARHVCWAHRIGKHETRERFTDDGEPSSTAGKPIMGQIYSHDLTDILVVVIRYFGGVKLGTGGLIVAYRSAAAEAIEHATIVERILFTAYRLTFPFDLINPVMMFLRNFQVETLSNDSNTDGYIWDIQVANADVQRFEEESQAMYQLKVQNLEADDL